MRQLINVIPDYRTDKKLLNSLRIDELNEEIKQVINNLDVMEGAVNKLNRKLAVKIRIRQELQQP
tara:strand:- start:67103 stop:67297 length:195 start_codon:yes stop_codon:yes gene_type:complete